LTVQSKMSIDSPNHHMKKNAITIQSS